MERKSLFKEIKVFSFWSWESAGKNYLRASKEINKISQDENTKKGYKEDLIEFFI